MNISNEGVCASFLRSEPLFHRMDPSQLVRIINREPKSFIGAFVLDTHFQTPPQMQSACARLLGFPSNNSFREAHPYLQARSIQEFLERGLASLVEGDQVNGYRIPPSLYPVKNALHAALKYVSVVGISFLNIFSDDTGAPSTERVLMCLAKGKDLRVRDIEEETEMAANTAMGTVRRFEHAGLVTYQNFPEGVQYVWNKEKNAGDLEPEIRRKIPMIYPGRGHLIYRAIEVGGFLHEHKPEPFGASEITPNLRFSKEKPSECYTAHACRVLQRLGFIIPTNDFHGCYRKSKVNLTLFGKGFVQWYSHILDYPTLPDQCASIEEAKSCLNVYSSIRRKQPSSERAGQIKEVLQGNPWLTKDELQRRVGVLCGKYLDALKKQGQIITQRGGNNKLTLLYALPDQASNTSL